jgi:hypothetical protein
MGNFNRAHLIAVISTGAFLPFYLNCTGSGLQLNSVSATSQSQCFATKAAQLSASTSTLYIANRTDGVVGAGTIANPYNGSSQSKFDSVMSAVPANSNVVIAPGTYTTQGGDNYALKTGVKVFGCGMGVTTLQLVDPLNTSNTDHFALATSSQADGTEVHDLTIDSNRQGQNFTSNGLSAGANPANHTHDYFGGVILWGNNCIIDSVEVIHAYGDSSNSGVDGQVHEGFMLYIGYGNGSQTITNALISNCSIHDYAPGSNYTTGYNISYGSNGIFQNDYDDGANHAFTFSGWNNGLMSGCTTTLKTNVGYYNDTASTTNIQICNNKLSAAFIPFQVNNGTTGNSTSGYTISGNYFVSNTNTGSGDAAIVLSGSDTFNSFIIVNNNYDFIGSQGYSYFVQNNGGTYYPGLVIDQNYSYGISSVALITSTPVSSVVGSNFYMGSWQGTSPAPNTYSNACL